IKDAMGFAPGSEVRRGRVAYILAYRVDDVAQAHGMDRAALLGAAMAHEVGHLLLSINAHSKTGIMRADWNEEDFRRASVKQLFFTAEQGTQIRSRMATAQEEALLATARNRVVHPSRVFRSSRRHTCTNARRHGCARSHVAIGLSARGDREQAAG